MIITTGNSTKNEIIIIDLFENLGINAFVRTVIFHLLIVLTFHLKKNNIKNNLYNSTSEKSHSTNQKPFAF